jgi:phosphoglycolate phosphatase
MWEGSRMQSSAHGADWPRAVIFDLDGTLVDSAPDIAASLNIVLVQRGLAPFPLDNVKRMIGGGVKQLINNALEAHGVATDDVDQLVMDMVSIYATRATELTRLFDGAGEVIERFHAAGIQMAVCTNKVQRVTDIIVRDLGIERFFAAVVGFGEEFPRKPSPAMLHHALAVMGVAPSDAVMIGDSGADAGAARAAGMPVVLAAFGYAPLSTIQELAPDGLLARFADLPQVLASLRR